MKKFDFTIAILAALLIVALIAWRGTSAQVPPNVSPSVHTRVIWSELAADGNWAGVRVAYLQNEFGCFLVFGEQANNVQVVACPAPPP